MKQAINEAGVFVYGAREHNLKSLNVFIPHNKITVVTGVSGSGKSSLVFDTIFAEGQRRYVESLSSYAKYFIEQLKRPDLDSITGLCPVVAIEQSVLNTNPRSTVGTLTESYDYVRLLFAKLGTAHCPQHKIPLREEHLANTTKLVCAKCDRFFSPLEPKLFSFNSPKGACPVCRGLGYLTPDTINNFTDTEIEIPVDNTPCHVCCGLRLKEQALQVTIKGKNISEWSHLTIDQLSKLCANLHFDKPIKIVADKILKKIQEHIRILQSIGLGYLSLGRSICTLSGGEAQRVRLARQTNSPLTGVLYILDEPSIGLHAKDQHKLLDILRLLKKRGNTVLLVEHDETTIRMADYIIDLGPGGGAQGGKLVCSGSVKDIMQNPRSLTGVYLSKQKQITIPQKQNKGTGNMLEIKKARGRNLKNITACLPLGCLIGVTGVSGSGKSTLIIDTLYKALLRHLYNNQSVKPASYQEIKGLQHIDKAIAVSQKPIGKTSRSVPATYIGVMSAIRNLFSYTPMAKASGASAKDFSFNIPGGRCEKCKGTGQIKQTMLFLPSTLIPCDECYGARYSNDILNIRYKGKNIYDVLNMNITTACKFFANHYNIIKQLTFMEQVGLGYLTLGQSSATLSGGEAQRIKITRELSKQNTGKTLYILDEPTTGLHFDDISRLIFILKKLTLKNSTVIIIEHHIDVIKACDWLIDLGPEGGSKGGQIMAQGTPEQVAGMAHSITAPYLKATLTF